MDGKEHFAIEALWTSFKIEAAQSETNRKREQIFSQRKSETDAKAEKAGRKNFSIFPIATNYDFSTLLTASCTSYASRPPCYSCVLIFMKKLMVWECFEKVPESEHRGGSQRKFKVIKTKMKNKKNPWKSHLIQHESLRCEQQQARSFKVYLSWNKHQHICWGENWQKAGRWKGERRKTLENI